MWQDNYSHGSMMGWDSTWHWLMSFHGLFSLFALAVIIFAIFSLYRDWQEEKFEDRGWRNSKHQ